jgi:phenylpropionate dioxygenase-like ring-hydroxylating dioxygenase large terminal subunit
MDRALQTRLASEIFRHMAAGTTDLVPEEMQQPVRLYFDPLHAARERAALFRCLPLVAAHGSELPEPGDFVTCDLAGTPVLIVRQDDRTVGAFTNVCRHRGTPVESEPRGNRRAFVCPFHAWSYERDGRLRGISYPEGFRGVDRSQYGLIALATEERHGFVWVVPAPGAAIDVAAHLGADLDRELSGWTLDRSVCERSARLENATNWKLVMDGFLEDYHLAVLHKKTVGPYFTRNLHRFESFGRHGRLVPVRANISEVRDRPPGEVDLLHRVIIIYVLFPSAVLLWQNDHFEFWTVFPDARDLGRCRITVRLLAPSADVVESERALWDKNWKILLDTVEQEDWVAARGIQAGLETGGQTHFVFGRNEVALQHFHRQLAAAVTKGEGLPCT